MPTTNIFGLTNNCASVAHCVYGSEEEILDEAYAGDIVGLPDTGNFKIGDTLTSGDILHFRGLPSFSPELFKYMKRTMTQ